MSTLRLRRAAFRIAAPDETAARSLAAAVESARPLLADALDGALGGLPARSIVVVRRLALGLRVTGEVSPAALASAWARSAAEALHAAWADAPAGDARDDAAVAVFASRAEAIRAHLLRRAAGLPDAWWAVSALTGGTTGGSCPHLPSPAALLCELTREDPHEAAMTLRAIACQDARALSMVDAVTAPVLSRLLAAALPDSMAMPPTRTTDAATTDDAASEDEALVAGILDATALALWRQLDATRRLPWLLAARLLAAREVASPRLPSARAPADATPSPVATEAPVAVETDAAGALLLLAPAATLFATDTLADRCRPAVLALLDRVLAPLPPAGRARALERERPLLDLLAPLPLPAGPVAAEPQDADAADLLAALIPQDIAWAPGAPRRIFGTLPPTDTPLARLLLRPGRLLPEPGGAAILWPHEAADLTLRRLGWDRDPGFVPWLGRTLRFVFGPAP